ncbi:MAG TPA: F0F1 ATP synthase subunit A [Nocardioides sp.]|nr:F0F1 ATP synthase subunit A [Nocardioides sp.]
MTSLLVPMADITIGEHKTVEFWGMTFNVDTIASTIVAIIAVLALGLWAARALAKNTDDHVPTKVQLIWETVVKEVNTQVEDNLGRVHPYAAPLAISIFFFVLFANWLELLPTELNEDTHLLPAPTADVNLTYALAAVTMVSVWTYGLRLKGARGYFRHFIEPFPVMLPLNILEELIKPVTLALRLFGNIFAGGIMLALIGALIGWSVSDIPIGGVVGFVFNIVWKLFDMFIGAIQAFIFALLTVLYFAMAGSGHEEHGDEHDHADDVTEASDETSPAEPTPVPAS